MFPEYINRYYRDDQELPYEEWIDAFKADLDKEAEGCTWDIRSAVWSDYGNGRDCELNKHEYKVRTHWIYDIAKELLDDMLAEGKYAELLAAIELLTENEAEMFVRHIRRVKRREQKYVLEDEMGY